MIKILKIFSLLGIQNFSSFFLFFRFFLKTTKKIQKLQKNRKISNKNFVYFFHFFSFFFLWHNRKQKIQQKMKIFFAITKCIPVFRPLGFEIYFDGAKKIPVEVWKILWVRCCFAWWIAAVELLRPWAARGPISGKRNSLVQLKKCQNNSKHFIQSQKFNPYPIRWRLMCILYTPSALKFGPGEFWLTYFKQCKLAELRVANT